MEFGTEEGKIMDGMFYTLLESTGGMQDIKLAIASKDQAAIVRAATGALRKTLSIPMFLRELKSAELSNKFRKEGNYHYLSKNYKETIQLYNKALAYAPNNSIELKLAYSNISAVLYTITAYQDCKLNIKAALELDCPEFLRTKLNDRMLKTETLNVIEMVRNVNLMLSDQDRMLDYAKLDVKRNDEIPCVSADVSVEDGKTVVAAKEIKSGTMVALERAFVSVQDEFEEYTSCYFCQKMSFFFIPCEGCCKALFCSKECREKCSEEYHRIECHIVAYMGTMYRRDVNKMAVRAAIKMSLKLGWEQLGVASLEMGEKRLNKSSVGEAFDCDNPKSMLCYNDQIDVTTDCMIKASIIVASAVYCLGRVPGYLPEGQKKRKKAIDALSRVMLQLKTTFLRKVVIMSSAYDYFNESFRCGVQRSRGWFSFTSKLAHSCEPNLLVVGLNDTVALVALQRIRKGDPLTISYIFHFYETTAYPKNTRIRQHHLYNTIQVLCQCRVCLLEWHNRSHQPGTLTTRQNLAYKKSKTAMTSGSFKQQMKGHRCGFGRAH